MKVFHQAGHNTKWNIDSFQDDEAGDGIIFSPVHYSSKNVSKLSGSLRQSSLFDPQFYVPNSQKTKLQSYDFFPEKFMSGFDTVDYQANAHESARLCIEFQHEFDFEAVVVPCRFYEDLVTDFVERQKAFTVDPFLNELSVIGTNKDIYLSLALTAPMLTDDRFRVTLLNWVTSYQELTGIYLQVDFSEHSKQILDYDKLFSFLTFARELVAADLKIICGYMNTEGLLAATQEIEAVTMGAYENTRTFSIDKFLVNDSIKTGPAPRIYLPTLLNWIRFDTALEIMEDFPALWDEIYSPTDYSEEVIASPRKPHFSQPGLYKHHFLLINEQYNEMSSLNYVEKLNLLREKVSRASRYYEELDSKGVLFFDKNCRGEHLVTWNRVLRNLRKHS